MLKLQDVIDWKSLVIAFSNVVFLFEFYLSYRQHRQILNVRKRTPELEKLMSKEDFDKTRAYSLDKSYFGFVQSIVLHAIGIWILYADILPLVWKYSLQFSSQWPIFAKYSEESEIVHSLMFVALFFVWNQLIGLPFSLYSTFVIEQRHGFNNQTFGLYVVDLIKTYILTGVIGLPLISGMLWVIKSTGDQFYFYLWLFMLIFQLIMLTIYPTLIQPLFNKVEPLSDGELKQKIESLAKSLNFPLSKLYVIDGSKRSNHSNAYFYGFFNNKRIVLFDTLISQMDSDEQILAVLGHEIGHWHYSHTLRMLTIAQVHTFAVFFTFSLINKNNKIFESFGFHNMPYLPIIISFTLFSMISSPAETLISFLMNMLSRYHEFQADMFAKQLNMASDLIQALLKLSVKNKGMLWPDPLYSAWHHSHPPILERIKALGGIEKYVTQSQKEQEEDEEAEESKKEKSIFKNVLRKRNK